MTNGQKKPDPCSFVVFGVTGDLAHRLVFPALYNLAATNLLPDKFCVVGIVRKAMSGDELTASLMKGLRQFATRPVDDAIAKRLFECVTCVEADPKEPASFDALRDRGLLDAYRRHIADRSYQGENESGRGATKRVPMRTASAPAARAAVTACSTWRRRRTPSCRSAGNSAVPGC